MQYIYSIADTGNHVWITNCLTIEKKLRFWARSMEIWHGIRKYTELIHPLDDAWLKILIWHIQIRTGTNEFTFSVTEDCRLMWCCAEQYKWLIKFVLRYRIGQFSGCKVWSNLVAALLVKQLEKKSVYFELWAIIKLMFIWYQLRQGEKGWDGVSP